MALKTLILHFFDQRLQNRTSWLFYGLMPSILNFIQLLYLLVLSFNNTIFVRIDQKYCFYNDNNNDNSNNNNKLINKQANKQTNKQINKNISKIFLNKKLSF